MTLIGYTTNVQNKIFSKAELLLWLNSDQNQSGFDSAMGASLVALEKRDADISTATLSGVCPREYALKQETPYTINLESSLKFIESEAFNRDMQALVDEDIDNRETSSQFYTSATYGKRVVTSDGRSVIVIAYVDQLLQTERGYITREYRRAASLPQSDAPFSIHLDQLNLTRWVLSSHGGNPLILHRNSGSFDAPKYPDAQPVDIVRSEVLYRDFRSAKRTLVGLGARTPFRQLDYVGAQVQKLVDMYCGQPIAEYEQAIKPKENGGLGFHWKCGYCPVASACHFHYQRYERPIDDESALGALRKSPTRYKVEVLGEDVL